ncbi:MAG: type II secretion system protein [Halieaceae bacterium]|jgi:general secretion pathway protein I|nr:type II secretion system protein [Halieaceae bacterium]
MRRRGPARGFSLLELLVAIAILGLSLGALLRSATTATRNVAIDERYLYAVELSKSLLAQYSEVPAAGFASSGETSGGFAWSVRARPVPRPRDSRTGEGRLQDMRVQVSWQDGLRERSVRLDSVVAGREAERRR